MTSPSSVRSAPVADVGRDSAAQVAERAAVTIKDAFHRYWSSFRSITARARVRFEAGDWTGSLADARERLDLYALAIARVRDDLRTPLGAHYHVESTWATIKKIYAERIAGVPADEIAETFFNSVTRHVLTTIGVNPGVEFVDFAFGRVPSGLGDIPFRSYAAGEPTDHLVATILEDYPFILGYANLAEDVAEAGAAIEAAWTAGSAPVPFECIEVLRPVFFRRKGAYLVGRVRGGHRVMPLVLALQRTDAGIRLDAALTQEDDVSVVFSFTHSYFHVDVERPTDVIEFLRSIMPLKPVAELYNALGFNKHGKTELYRQIRRHLAHTDERFEAAAGTPGMVMAVFTMPGLDIVFKVIRDSFPPPKRTTPQAVRRRYDLVFQHDRAGRLVDAQEFGHLTFDRHRFSRDLLTDLQETAGRSVTVTDDAVTFAHLYTERRVTPLNVFLERADPMSRRRVVVDYGRAIEELASTGVFPGDLLFKNFGVTRHGRVIFYDYDELCLLAECTFRRIPTPPTPEDEWAAEPWFHVAPGDVFPEEFIRFLGLPTSDRAAFLRAHGRIFDAAYWREVQAEQAAGEVVDIFPYHKASPSS